MTAQTCLSRRLRVGIVANSYQKLGGAQSGSFIHLLQVARCWTDAEIVFFAPEEARAAVRDALPGAEFVAAPPRRTPRWLDRQTVLVGLMRVFGIIRQRHKLRRCDFVIAMTAFFADVFPMLLISRTAAVVPIHHLQTAPWRRAGSAFSNWRSWITERVGLSITKWRAGVVLAYDQQLARRIIGRRSATIVRRFSNGVDHLRCYESVTALPRPRVAAFVGRLEPTKGLDDLLHAWALVARAVPTARLQIVGSGRPKYYEHLQELARQLDIVPTVFFLGALCDESKCALLRSARVFAFPSREEGWGVALAEAMLFGVPCVTYDLAAYRGVFTEGRLEVPFGDVRTFADAVIRLLTDDPLHGSMSRRASRLARSFTWQRVANTYCDAFRAVLASRKADSASA